MDKIFINNLNIETIIGIYDYELNNKQTIILDLEIEIDSKKAAQKDNITDTIDYDYVLDYIYTYCDQNNFNLLETLAENICKNLIQKFNIPWLKLSITKPKAVRYTNSIGIVIERSKDDFECKESA